MNDPSERITLALKPKAGSPDATTRRIPNMAAGSLPAGLDPAVFSELQQATQTYDYLKRFGEPVEFWEAVRLARSRRGVTVSADGSAESGTADAGLAEELQVIRRQLSPMVHDLRRYLAKVPDLPAKGEALEVALGFLLASSREHQAVAKWLAESDKHLGKAASKLRSLYDIAAPYLEVLRPWSLDGAKPAPPPAAPGAPAAAPGKPAAPAAAAPLEPLSADQLENFKRSFQVWKLFIEAELQCAFWEILVLNTAERIPCQTKLDTIVRAKQEKKLTVYHEEIRNFHARLLPLRASHGRWVDATAGWLKTLKGVPQEGLFEMALGVLVLESGAKDRAKRWLTNPQASTAEAGAHLNALALQVKSALPALK